jgi:thymidylate synthase
MHIVPTPITGFWHDVYHANLMQAFLSEDEELINHTFTLADPTRIELQSDARHFNPDFSAAMFGWIIGGNPNIPESFYEMNPQAKNYGTMFQAPGKPLICVAYGPRIVEQLPYVIQMLESTEGTTRRACVMVLNDKDRFVGKALENKETNCEYPCTLGFNFRVRHGKLDMTTSMRSNNYTTTVCQDIAVFTRLQEYVATEIGVDIGTYFHHTMSGHILPPQRERAVAILEEYATGIGPNIHLTEWGGGVATAFDRKRQALSL